MKKTLYITGSFPRLGDGIGDAAGRLYDAMEDKNSIILVTSDIVSIHNYICEKKYNNVIYVKNWKATSINLIMRYIKEENIKNVLIEYAGNGYKKDLAISFLPLIIRLRNLHSKEKVQCHLRLHEFSMCRPARKIFTYPLVWFCHHLDTPSYVEYKILRDRFGDKVSKSSIGSNINWRDTKKDYDIKPGNKIKLAFFGGIYPGKGIETLIDIWSKLDERYPEKYDYQLLGGFPEKLTNAFDDYQIKISKLMKEKGLQNKITISGFLPEEEIEGRLDQVDIAILPFEDGLTLRRGSFLAFLGRNVAVVTTEGDAEASAMFKDAKGVRMCRNADEMISNIIELSEKEAYVEAGVENAKYEKYFEWKHIAKCVLGCFE